MSMQHEDDDDIPAEALIGLGLFTLLGIVAGVSIGFLLWGGV